MKKELVFASCLFFMVSCGQSKDMNQPSQDETPQLLEVELQGPERIEANKQATYKVIVTYGNEKVEDADSVQVEIKPESQEEKGEMIEARFEGGGEYAMSTSFQTEGTYIVQAHVNAKSMHVMNKKLVEVEKTETQISMEGEHDHQAEEVPASHHIKMDIQPVMAVKGKETELVTSIIDSEKPLIDANVRYEIWHENDVKHEWMEAEENTAGKYSSSYTFSKAGNYYVQIHAENDKNLHEHKQVTIQVN